MAPVKFGSTDIIAAYSRIRGQQRWFWANTQATDPARLRFSLAHELGHAVLHWERIADPVVVDAETEAHHFASAFLMPADEIKRQLNRVTPNLANLTRVATQWQVSVQALVMRAKQVGSLSAAEHAGVWRMLNARGLAKAALVDVHPEPPGVLASLLALHREEHGHDDAAIAEMTGLPLARLQDLMPSLFPIRQTRRLRAV
ncbi:ImmA/IrrE family metallo-endopeptidase [Conexibacter sp. W3-3-2]|uniref:ImmA/IrrE family metallo-endopeptidase n=1 Tax=Conexibacter sp. W3-3-2 TaxID=2675227 RepID=UPI002815008B|nr:ImmA/IrrE family metallo-endopeptidase [Conexibacter sp. W3-3-2]